MKNCSDIDSATGPALAPLLNEKLEDNVGPALFTRNIHSCDGKAKAKVEDEVERC